MNFHYHATFNGISNRGCVGIQERSDRCKFEFVFSSLHVYTSGLHHCHLVCSQCKEVKIIFSSVQLYRVYKKLEYGNPRLGESTLT